MASPFSGKAGRQAAVWTANMANEQFDALAGIYGEGWGNAKNQIAQGFKPVSGLLRTGFTGARDILKRQYSSGRRDLREGVNRGIGSLDQGLAVLNQMYGQGAQTLTGAADEFNPLIQKNMAGLDMYQNSLGINGAEGNQAARDAFLAGPGYQWQVEQATEAAQRAANKTGMLYSGNQVDAVTRLGSNLANQEYGSWQDKLSGFGAQALGAQNSRANVLNQLATLYQAQGKDQATIRGQQGSMYANMGAQLADLGQTYGQNQAGLRTTYYGDQAQTSVGRGQSLANVDIGLMNNMADAANKRYDTIIQAGQQGLMAGQQAAANRMGALMGGLQLGGQLLGGLFGGGAGGGGGFLSGLFK